MSKFLEVTGKVKETILLNLSELSLDEDIAMSNIYNQIIDLEVKYMEAQKFNKGSNGWKLEAPTDWAFKPLKK